MSKTKNYVLHVLDSVINVVSTDIDNVTKNDNTRRAYNEQARLIILKSDLEQALNNFTYWREHD